MSIFWKRFFTIGGWFTWVMAGVTVVTAVGGAVMANKQAKDAKKQAAATNAQSQAAIAGQPLFTPPELPGYQPWNFKSNQARAIEEDANAYARSDADFRKRHKPIVGAEKAFEAEVAKDWAGEHELMPQLQSEFMRAGIADTLGSLGTTGAGSVLAPGSAGEANVARHLGLDIMGFQDRNRTNRQKSLSMAEEIFPRRTFGMTGQDYVQSSIADVENKNAWAAANYEREFEAEKARVGQAMEQSNAAMTSQNAMAKAQAEADAARNAAIASAATTALQAGAGAYGSKYGAGATSATRQPAATSVSGAVRPSRALYPGGTTWQPVGKYYA